MVNIRDIAAMSGVSKSTVSRVINNKKHVSAEIRAKVQAAIEQTGYHANGNAIKLSSGKNFTLGVTLPYNNACYDDLINSILYHTKERGYQVLLLPTYYEEDTEQAYYALLEQKMIDGLILTSRSGNNLDWEDLKKKGRIVSAEKIAAGGLSMIYPDRKRVYEDLFSRLRQADNTNVVFTVKRGPRLSTSAKDKIDSFEKYYGAAVLGRDYYTEIEGYKDGAKWATATFENKIVPEVIYANGDDTAAGIISGLNKLGFVHKTDYQIIGEGNAAYSELLAFSTIDFLPAEIGKDVVDFILSEEKRITISKNPVIIWR